MSKKFRLLMVLVLVTGLFGGLLTASTVSADPVSGIRFQIPRIDLGDPFVTGISDWATKIQVQNLGPATTVTATFYGPYKGTGVFPALGKQTMWLPVRGVWTLHNVLKLNFPTAESAIITTALSTDEVAVTVDRWGTDAYGAFEISSSYTGIEDAMDGYENKYFAPYVMYNYNNLDTTLTIQNSGLLYTASVWIYYKQQGNCEYQVAQHIESLSPGEAIRVGPGKDADVKFPAAIKPGWLGSAYISSAVPLGIITDQLSHPTLSTNRGTLTTFRGMPYKPATYDPVTGAGAWGTKWYADLLYREISGWDASIQVQNLTQKSMPTFVCVDFMDNSGDEILFVCDWICRNGALTFFLPAITDLGINFPFGYVGAAEIYSFQQVDYPGVHHENGESIFAVVDIKKSKVYDAGIFGWRHTVAGETQAGAYNAHPEEEKLDATGWAMPFVAKEGNGVTTRFALRNNANCNKFEGKIWIMDETGTDVGVIHIPWLHPKHLKIIDLAYQGFLYPGFVGAARFEVLGVEQLCDTNGDGITDQEPVMPSIVVLNYGFAKELPIGGGAGPQTTEGDLTRVYEAIPYVVTPRPCTGSLFGTVSVRQESHGFDRAEINDATVSVGDLTATTNSTGGYQIKNVREGAAAMTFVKTGFFDGAATPTVECGKETLQDKELVCSNPLYVTVEDTAGNPIPGATVSVAATYQYTFDTNETKTDTGPTNNAGKVTINVAGAATLVGTASAFGHDTKTGVGIVANTARDNSDCYEDAVMNFTGTTDGLCKWNTIVGTVTIGNQAAAGYTLKAIQMSNPLLPVVDTDVTTAAGVYALENLSLGSLGPDYRIQLWSPSNTYIGFTDITVAGRCGGTGVLTYANGVWSAVAW